jgi:hypothetical protein
LTGVPLATTLVGAMRCYPLRIIWMILPLYVEWAVQPIAVWLEAGW